MLKIAFIGTNEGNGHVFSWSAIINGKYDKEMMRNCGYPVIVDYLSKQPEENLGIQDTKVTHVWTADKDYSYRVAKTTFIENVVDRPEDVIGRVDGVFITTDIGSTHVNLAKPFIDANVPVFIDKPLCDNIYDLKTFYHWYKQGKNFISSSSLRYAKEIENLNLTEYGSMQLVSCIMSKTWERYGVHAIEGIYTIVRKNIKSVFNIGDENINIVHLEFIDGTKGLIQNIKQSTIFGRFDIFCENKTITITAGDYFTMFKKQIENAIEFMKTKKHPYPFSETLEIIEVVIAGIKSRQESRKIELSEIKKEIENGCT
ncbi:MAG: Gfo/Idh/MocA family oxidoreductase [Candidatus Omnitrophica bacterium]|nr:Gfo/Idh/MocA family oxidoreductase [Candidatus Omnitrophota bacterium]